MKLPVFPVEGGCQFGAMRCRLTIDRVQPWVHIDASVPGSRASARDRQPLFDAFVADVAKG